MKGFSYSHVKNYELQYAPLEQRFGIFNTVLVSTDNY
jgi:hypothetical protein